MTKKKENELPTEYSEALETIGKLTKKSIEKIIKEVNKKYIVKLGKDK